MRDGISVAIKEAVYPLTGKDIEYIEKETIKNILWNQKYSDSECLEKIAELVGIHRK